MTRQPIGIALCELCELVHKRRNLALAETTAVEPRDVEPIWVPYEGIKSVQLSSRLLIACRRIGRSVVEMACCKILSKRLNLKLISLLYARYQCSDTLDNSVKEVSNDGDVLTLGF